jgi:hypothetical protein
MAGFQEVGAESGHLQDAAHGGAAAGDRPVAPPGAAVAIDRSAADEGGNPGSIEAAELGQLGDQGAGGDLADAGHRGQQVLGGAPGRRATDLLGEARDQLGIQPIGRGEAADGAGEGADLGRIDDRERQAGGGDRGRAGDLEAAGRLEHDQLGAGRDQARHQLLETLAVARDRQGLGGRAQMHVELILGAIDADQHEPS